MIVAPHKENSKALGDSASSFKDIGRSRSYSNASDGQGWSLVDDKYDKPNTFGN